MPPLPWNHWTWWDYVLLCQALTKKSADGRRYETFGSGGPGFGGGLNNFIYQAGGSLLNDAGTEIALDSPAGAAAAQYLYDLVNTFHVVPSAEDQSAQTGGGGWGGQSILGLYSAGKLGTILIGRWGLIKVRREARFTTEIYLMPRYVPYEEWKRWMSDPEMRANPSLRDGPWGEVSETGRHRGKAAEMGGRVTAIRKGTQHEREAFYFLEYLSSPDFNNLLTKDADAFGSRKQFSVRYFSLYNTVFLMLGLPLSIGGSLLLAIVLSQKLRGIIIYRTVFYLPTVTNGVALFLLWKWLYNPKYGLINSILLPVLSWPYFSLVVRVAILVLVGLVLQSLARKVMSERPAQSPYYPITCSSKASAGSTRSKRSSSRPRSLLLAPL